MGYSRFSKLIVVLGALLVPAGVLRALPYTLTTGSGDGTVTIGVDGFGSFGSNMGANASNAMFDPVGSGGPAGTAYNSGIAFRIGSSGSRSFLTSGSIGGSGSLANPAMTGTTTSASSTPFSPPTAAGLTFALTQTIAPFVGNLQTGSILTQTYDITNTSAGTINFELLRYLDGDLLFDMSVTGDGGGRVFVGSIETLFETDTAKNPTLPTIFVAMSAEGGTIPVTGRYEVDFYADLRSKILAGTALDDSVAGDGADANTFIDAGPGYDVALALNNQFSVIAGGTVTYTVRTIFVSGSPTPTPESGSSFVLLGLALGALRWLQRKTRA